MSPSVRLEDDVFQGLKKIAEPFSDTPNSVIRRLLEEKGVLSKAEAPSSEEAEATRDSLDVKVVNLTPQSIYETFLVHVLQKQFDGRGAKHEVTAAVIAE